MLNECIAGMRGIRKADIIELKALSAPPEGIKFVMKAIMVALGQEPTWIQAKKELSVYNFHQKLNNYDLDNITPALVKKLKKFTKNDSFSLESIKSKSASAAGLVCWLSSVQCYGEVRFNMRDDHPTVDRQLKQPEDFDEPPFAPAEGAEAANVNVEIQRPRASMVN